jgi:hypothetical protein
MLPPDADEAQHGRRRVALLRDGTKELRALGEADCVVAAREIRGVLDGGAGDGDLMRDGHEEAVFGVFAFGGSDLKGQDADAGQSGFNFLLNFAHG